MSEMTMLIRYRLELDSKQMSLVLRALGGRLKPEHVEAAKAFGDELSQSKLTQFDHYAREIEKLRSNMEVD